MRLRDIIKGITEGAIRYVKVAKVKKRPPMKPHNRMAAKMKPRDYDAKRKTRRQMAKASRRRNRYA